MLALALAVVSAAHDPAYELCRAAEQGKPSELKALLVKGKPLPRCAGPQPLVVARAASRRIEADALAALDALIEAGADFSEVDSLGDTAMSSARLPAVVRKLIAAGAKCDEHAFKSLAPLFKADVVELLLDGGCTLTPSGTVAAAQTRDPEVVKLVLARGGRVDARDAKTDATPLHAAALDGTAATVKVLLEANADVAAKAKGTTPLDRARDVEVARLLLSAGSRYSEPDLVLTFATDPLFELVLEQKPRLAAKAWHAIHEAAKSNRADRVAKLVAIGASADAKDSLGASPLMMAIESNARAATAALVPLSRALDLQRVRDGSTALMLAAEANDAVTVKALLAAGANATLKDREGRTARARAEDARCAAVLPLLGAARRDNGVDALIWSEGTTPADGEQWLKRWNDEARELPHQRMVTLAPGYPKVVQSDELPGLEPGRFVVLLGTCAGDASRTRLGVLKAFSERIEARPIKLDAKSAQCPELVTEYWRKTTVTLSTAANERLQATELALPSPDRTTSWLVVLRGAGGELLDFRQLDGSTKDQWSECEATLVPSGSGLKVVRACERWQSGPCWWPASTETTLITSGSGSLELAKKNNSSRSPSSCGE